MGSRRFLSIALRQSIAFLRVARRRARRSSAAGSAARTVRRSPTRRSRIARCRNCPTAPWTCTACGGTAATRVSRNQLKPGELDSIMLPWAKQLMASRKETDNPYFYCMPGGPIRLTGGFGWRFLQHPTVNAKYIFQIQEGNSHSYRQIFMDGRKHPEDPSPTWYGHSIGRWEGPTLVIDTIGLNDKFWMDRNGTPHTEQLHLVERWTRDTFITMQRAVTVDDPGAFITAVHRELHGEPGRRRARDHGVLLRREQSVRAAGRHHEPEARGAIDAATSLLLAGVLAFLGAAAPAAAHPAPFSYLDVRLRAGRARRVGGHSRVRRRARTAKSSPSIACSIPARSSTQLGGDRRAAERAAAGDGGRCAARPG